MTPDPGRQLGDRALVDRALAGRALSVHAAAEDRPTRIALIAPDGRRWTWSELSTEVSAVEPETVPGSGILTATSTPTTVVRILASIERALPVVPVDPRLSGPEQRARIELLERDRGTGAAGVEVETRSPDDRRPLAVLFTSGSSGTPRAVELSRAAFVASAWASEQRLGWTDDDRWLCVLPLAHVGGLSILIRCLVARRTIVLLERFDAELVSQVIERERVTIASFVPTMLSRLLALDPAWRAPSSLRAVLLGGAAAPDDLWADALCRGLPLLETWGMTETCSQVATAIPGESPRSPVPLRGWSVRSRDGRLEVKGAALLTRYIGRDEDCNGGAGDGGDRPEPSPLSADGWFSTGDLGTVNPDGSVSIGGRADAMIVTGGENVSPSEVERVLESVPGVRRAVVVGLPDPEWGETVAAAVERDQDRARPEEAGADPKADERVEQELQAAFSQRLATFRRPRTIIWMERLPETSSGKIDRAEVRRRILDQGTAGSPLEPQRGA
jgi:O-succinylbenzoic acid--CoA ligase